MPDAHKIIKKYQTLIVSAVLFFLAYVVYDNLLNPQECNYYLERPLRILSASPIHWYCQQVIAINIGLILTILAGMGFLFYWLIIGRVQSRHLFLISVRTEKTKVKWKMAITMTVTAIGIASMAFGFNMLMLEPPITHDHISHRSFELVNNKKGDLILKFHAPNGLMPNRGINTDVIVKLPEKTNNTSFVQIEFSQAGVMDNESGGIPIVGKPIILNYSGSDSKFSSYTLKDIHLTYDYDGNYNAILTVNNSTVSPKTIESVITIGDWSDYLAQQANYQTQGLALIVLGTSIITTVVVFTKFVDLRYEYFELKRKEFYE